MINTDWYTIYDLKLNKPLVSTISKSEVIRYLDGKQLDRFRVDKTEYIKQQSTLSAEQFIKDNK